MIASDNKKQKQIISLSYSENFISITKSSIKIATLIKKKIYCQNQKIIFANIALKNINNLKNFVKTQQKYEII